MGIDVNGPAVQATPATIVILLDTNALIWIEQRHARARPLLANRKQLYISPASLLELQFLTEAGRIRFRHGCVSDLAAHPNWLLDDPPAADWFDRALDLGWTRDPFDRLIVAHARTRGWRVATGDTNILGHLPERERLAV